MDVRSFRNYQTIFDLTRHRPLVESFGKVLVFDGYDAV